MPGPNSGIAVKGGKRLSAKARYSELMKAQSHRAVYTTGKTRQVRTNALPVTAK